MDFVTCPECKSLVDLKSEVRYSPDRGANIFHAPCYIARLRAALSAVRSESIVTQSWEKLAPKIRTIVTSAIGE